MLDTDQFGFIFTELNSIQIFGFCLFVHLKVKIISHFVDPRKSK